MAGVGLELKDCDYWLEFIRWTGKFNGKTISLIQKFWFESHSYNQNLSSLTIILDCFTLYCIVLNQIGLDWIVLDDEECMSIKLQYLCAGMKLYSKLKLLYSTLHFYCTVQYVYSFK